MTLRLDAVEHGHDAPTRATFALMRLGARTEIPDILKVLAYRHRYFGTPFNEVTQAAMRGPSAWSVGERELFAALTSSRNSCRFCTTAHTAFASSVEPGETVTAALEAPESAPLRPEVRAVLTFLAKLADEPESMTADDVRTVLAAGVSEDALAESVDVGAIFHLINRVMDAHGAAPLEGRGLAVSTRVVMGGGYKLPAPIRLLSRRG